jgi:hypothetical protein
LLIETIECYRQGFPSSSESDWKDLEKHPANKSAPVAYKITKPFPKLGSKKVFTDFFQRQEHAKFFPSAKGDKFYKEIRCGLLHQAQTTDGWRIVRTGKFWDEPQKTINREEFAQRLQECFGEYLDELCVVDWTAKPWEMARKKIWWLAQVS